ncbi:hypothetical protein [Paludibaculum fermentans]|uniref:hypothetical protein n=1 Tax=Paludibaculum fermentans TaxID=1473598 RepID=UPI003EBB29A3
MTEEVGLLVFGDNHFIVRGPRPTLPEALALARRWSLITIGSGIVATDEQLPWRVSTREFREELSWAVRVDERPPSEAVTLLLRELEQRGVEIRMPNRASLKTES